MRLKEKVALIPGGTSGIGREIVRGFIREGATVVAASSTKDKVDKMTQEFKAQRHEGFCSVVDITDKAEVEEMVKKVVETFGRVDVLVNAAGFYPPKPFIEITEEELLAVVNLNLCGAFFCGQAVAKEMVENGSGSIINIASGQALLGVSLMAHYSAAKGGLVALTRAMASELSPLGIRVNAIAAGLTTTETVVQSMPPDSFEAMQNRPALRRLAKPDEYVGTAVLLASEEGAYITGETISVDGGYVNVESPLLFGGPER